MMTHIIIPGYIFALKTGYFTKSFLEKLGTVQFQSQNSWWTIVSTNWYSNLERNIWFNLLVRNTNIALFIHKIVKSRIPRKSWIQDVPHTLTTVSFKMCFTQYRFVINKRIVWYNLFIRFKYHAVNYDQNWQFW